MYNSKWSGIYQYCQISCGLLFILCIQTEVGQSSVEDDLNLEFCSDLRVTGHLADILPPADIALKSNIIFFNIFLKFRLFFTKVDRYSSFRVLWLCILPASFFPSSINSLDLHYLIYFLIPTSIQHFQSMITSWFRQKTHFYQLQYEKFYRWEIPLTYWK